MLALGEEGDGVVVDHAADGGFGLAAAAEFHDEVRNSGRFTWPPVARRVRH